MYHIWQVANQGFQIFRVSPCILYERSSIHRISLQLRISIQNLIHPLHAQQELGVARHSCNLVLGIKGALAGRVGLILCYNQKGISFLHIESMYTGVLRRGGGLNKTRPPNDSLLEPYALMRGRRGCHEDCNPNVPCHSPPPLPPACCQEPHQANNEMHHLFTLSRLQI